MLEILRKPQPIRFTSARLTRSPTALEEELSAPMPTMPPCLQHSLPRSHPPEGESTVVEGRPWGQGERYGEYGHGYVEATPIGKQAQETARGAIYGQEVLRL
ncbi:hypothetical protein DPMN_115739 [Dreissena polymorpha]|uniref:Uncharacterized protein n=1 Tax=Dreissena polymorpha TaxID=45954 RepID=A0A9D4KLR3_DREPO|nr:hypothetical protein DPMN_115739 [Dreissena polymorpha]